LLNDTLYEQLKRAFDHFPNAIPKLLRRMYCSSGEGRKFETSSLNDVLNESILSSVARIGNFATYKIWFPKAQYRNI